MQEIKWNNREIEFEKSEAYFEVVKQKVNHKHVKLPKCFLGDTPEEALEIYNNFSKDLNHISRSYATITGLEQSDLFGEALIGLGRARVNFDPERGYSFRTYALSVIKSFLDEHVRIYLNVISIPSYLKKASKNLNIYRALTMANEISLEDSDFALIQNKIEDLKMNKDATNRCTEAAENFRSAAERAKISTEELVLRISILPTHVDFENVEDILTTFVNEEVKLNTMLLVDKMKESMSEDEIFVAEGIMEGKTEKEIGESHVPPRSRSWVSKIVEGLKNKFKGISWSS